MSACKRCGGTGQEPDDRAIGQRMRELRESLDLSLRTVATRVGISPAYLSDLELGRRHWNTAMQTRVSKVVPAPPTAGSHPQRWKGGLLPHDWMGTPQSTPVRAESVTGEATGE